ncbi:type I DNA topoisomerase [Parasulfuritortus cantonensis]|uniref:DNA topoisomerase 1 n=1 Tax=Parasulfuritortus cantonensis TaxID=2528202 RepID=A0A4R1B495_9PROT|nr:type I DNA topoisomerase [Parasulfuritortus cantonensis]TCJ12914.1 type I DNA topoisomerase [Parasulfuritortus cantonensis]
MKLLIVESPSKAKTLKKYLGGDYEVLASYGHVRDLTPKTGSVEPDKGFAMKYELIERNAKHVEAIAKAVKKADEVLIATDPDREGEAIAWHLTEILNARKLLDKKPAKRVVFYEITERAVKEAVANPRNVAMELVNAQQARRALDYLVGFNLSPLLWKKISPGLSAGRVQSPALRLIVEREEEIEKFQAREYWTLHLDSHKGKQKFAARLTQFDGEKIQQFSVADEARSNAIIAALNQASEGQVVKVEKKRRQRQPAAPFTTSTLQQEAVRKLGFSAERAMRVAQQLYEGIDAGKGAVGLITYMRTDSVNLSQEAVADIRQYIGKHFSADYLPKSAVVYRSKAKNAQEAHEAIRPTAIARTPESVREHLSQEQFKLYEMIWKRALACQMAAAELDTVAVDIAVGSPRNLFRANGQTIAFDGFLAVYKEDEDEPTGAEDEARLPALAEGETVPVDRLYGEQHFTQPPPRYSEASLVKTLEEHGIGRPSTYASIISTLLHERDNVGAYAVLDKKRFKPTPIGRLINCFLTRHFHDYVDYDFTAHFEDELDEISNGERDWIPVMGEFWGQFSGELDAKAKVERGCPVDEACPKCGKPLLLQSSKRGLFIGCSGYPECDYTRPFGDQPAPGEDIVLGDDPATGLPIKLLNGRFGWYVQVGDMPEDKKAPKPKRASWPKDQPVEAADLATALRLLSLPRELGHHPTSGLAIVANTGRFGPYLLHDGKFKSIPKQLDVYTIDLAQALEVLAAPAAGRGAASPGRELGKHPADGQPVTVRDGRYGPYVSHGKLNATLRKDMNPDAISLDEALALLAAKAEKGPAKKPARARKAS